MGQNHSSHSRPPEEVPIREAPRRESTVARMRHWLDKKRKANAESIREGAETPHDPLWNDSSSIHDDLSPPLNQTRDDIFDHVPPAAEEEPTAHTHTNPPSLDDDHPSTPHPLPEFQIEMTPSPLVPPATSSPESGDFSIPMQVRVSEPDFESTVLVDPVGREAELVGLRESTDVEHASAGASNRVEVEQLESAVSIQESVESVVVGNEDASESNRDLGESAPSDLHETTSCHEPSASPQEEFERDNSLSIDSSALEVADSVDIPEDHQYEPLVSPNSVDSSAPSAQMPALLSGSSEHSHDDYDDGSQNARDPEPLTEPESSTESHDNDDQEPSEPPQQQMSVMMILMGPPPLPSEHTDTTANPTPDANNPSAAPPAYRMLVIMTSPDGTARVAEVGFPEGLPPGMFATGATPPTDETSTGLEAGGNYDAFLRLAEMIGPARPRYASLDDVKEQLTTVQFKHVVEEETVVDESSRRSSIQVELTHVPEVTLPTDESRLKGLLGESKDKCTVCLMPYEEGDTLRILNCNHGFHSECIDEWLTSHVNSCPLCRQPGVEITRDPVGQGPEQPTNNLHHLQGPPPAFIQSILRQMLQTRAPPPTAATTTTTTATSEFPPAPPASTETTAPATPLPVPATASPSAAAAPGNALHAALLPLLASLFMRGLEESTAPNASSSDEESTYSTDDMPTPANRETNVSPEPAHRASDAEGGGSGSGRPMTFGDLLDRMLESLAAAAATPEERTSSATSISSSDQDEASDHETPPHHPPSRTFADILSQSLNSPPRNVEPSMPPRDGSIGSLNGRPMFGPVPPPTPTPPTAPPTRTLGDILARMRAASSVVSMQREGGRFGTGVSLNSAGASGSGVASSVAPREDEVHEAEEGIDVALDSLGEALRYTTSSAIDAPPLAEDEDSLDEEEDRLMPLHIPALFLFDDDNDDDGDDVSVD
ncbi:hypothetical protein HDU98_003453 [Podochytrium sp. JEL0797]|nr:hypothetical protein HDU98_003453 [Podochytrium sp. JEL0797]